MLERKFYLETHKLHRKVRGREKRYASRRDAEHAEKTNNRVKRKVLNMCPWRSQVCQDKPGRSSGLRGVHHVNSLFDM